MSRTFRFAPILLVTLAFSAATSAQERRQGGGGNGLPPYNTTTEITVSGTVAGTQSRPTMSGLEMLEVNLTVDGHPLHVILGPVEYVKKQSFSFAANAKAEAIGMPGLRIEGEPAMIARQVKIGTRTLTLRDASGKPAWNESSQR